MKPIQILRSYQRGAKAVQQKKTSFVMFLLCFIAIIAVVGIFTDPSFASTGMHVFAGSGLLSMFMGIGDIGDVSDQFTSGENIYREFYLIDVDEQIDTSQAFPSPNASRQVGTIPMTAGQYMKKYKAHSFPKYNGTGEMGDNTSTGKNTFAVVMAGMRAQLLNLSEQHIGKPFIIIFRELNETTYHIIGSLDRPIYFKSFETKNDGDGRYVTLNFERNSVIQYHDYIGTIITQAAGALAAGATALSLVAGQDNYTVPNGAAAAYAIATLSGLTASDKGRVITLTGTGTTFPATIADNTAFVLEDGATWTAKSGSKLVLRVLDSGTLVEVQGSRIQTA